MVFIRLAKATRKNANTRNWFLSDEALVKLLYPTLKNIGKKWTMSV